MTLADLTAFPLWDNPLNFLLGPAPQTLLHRAKFELLTKAHIFTGPPRSKHKKQCRGSHPMHRIIRFKFITVAERRQWPSAVSRPRRKTRVKLWPHFWAANVPSHQICRNRRASRYSGAVCLAKSRRTAGSK